MSEVGEVPNSIEVEKPTVLYRGSREKFDLLKPKSLLETEKNRFPSNTGSVVFASQYKQEALAYAIASRSGVGNFMVAPFWKNEEKKEIGWKLQLSCKSSDLPREDKTYLYEIDPKNFSINSEGEWYSKTETVPTKRRELTVDEALNQFDEVSFA